MILCWGEVKATVGRIVQMRRGGSEAKPSTLTSASADPHVPLENSIATGRSAAEPRSPLSLAAPTPPYPRTGRGPLRQRRHGRHRAGQPRATPRHLRDVCRLTLASPRSPPGDPLSDRKGNACHTVNVFTAALRLAFSSHGQNSKTSSFLVIRIKIKNNP